MTRIELEALARKVLKNDNLGGLGDEAAAVYLIAKATGISDAGQRSDTYRTAALALLAQQHGVQLTGIRADAAAGNAGPVYRQDALGVRDAEAIRLDVQRKAENAWRRPTVGATSGDEPAAAPQERRDAAGQELDADAARAAFCKRTEDAWRDPAVKVATADPVESVSTAWRGALQGRTGAADEPRADASLEELAAATEARRLRVRTDSEAAWAAPPTIGANAP